jgi:hypothetical protein
MLAALLGDHTELVPHGRGNITAKALDYLGRAARAFRRSLELARESGDDSALLTALLGVWTGHGTAARLDDAAETARQIMIVAERIAGEAPIRIGGEKAAEAERRMRRAIAIAAEQGAKLWEMRTTTSLSRLLAKQ